jgi:cell division protein FtsQ
MALAIASTSRSEMAQRRQQLRHQRRLRWLQASWQLIALSGFTGGAIWLMTSPLWVLRTPTQVTIQGNQFLSNQTIQRLLPLSYPQSLLSLKPQRVIQVLETQAPIAKATVTRHLWPPSLTIQVQERPPVAVSLAQPLMLHSGAKASVSLIDEYGVSMPLDNYKATERNRILPKLKVIGLRPHDRPYWRTLYRTVISSPIKIRNIDWRDSANLILETDLGLVHFGPYTPKLATQLQTLDQMRQLPDYVNRQRVAYIDLKNPDAPALQVKDGSPKPR